MPYRKTTSKSCDKKTSFLDLLWAKFSYKIEKYMVTFLTLLGLVSVSILFGYLNIFTATIGCIACIIIVICSIVDGEAQFLGLSSLCLFSIVASFSYTHIFEFAEPKFGFSNTCRQQISQDGICPHENHELQIIEDKTIFCDCR